MILYVYPSLNYVEHENLICHDFDKKNVQNNRINASISELALCLGGGEV